MGVNMLPWLRLVVGLFVVLAAGPGQAAWRVAEGIDIASGGASTLLIGELDERTALYARCVAGTPELFVDSFDGSDAELAPAGEVTLIITTDVGRSWSSPARYAREKSGYVTTTWLADETIGSVVADIAAAKAAVSISIEFEEIGAATWDTDAKGSTAAARKFLEACPPSAGATPAAPSAVTPAAQPAAADGAWTVSVEPDPLNGGEQISLIGDLDQGGYFYAFCNGRRVPALFFVSNNPQTFPYELGDVGLTLRVEIDGEERSAPGEVLERSDGGRAILYTGHEYVPALLEAVAGARTEVAMTIHSYSNEITTRWPAKNLVGLADGMARLRAHCFGTATTELAEPTAPASAPETADTGTPWAVQARPEADGTTSYTLNGEAISGFGALFFACISEGGVYAGFSTATEDLPGYSPGAPMQMTISFGTFNYDFDSKVAAMDDSAITVFSENAAMAGIAAEALTYGVERITVTVRDVARGIEYVRQIGPNNSAYAADDFLTRCEASAAGSAPAAAPPGSWEVLVGEAASSYGARAMMTSSPAADQSFAALACLSGGDDWAFFILAPDAPEPPFPASDHGYMLNLSIDDAQFSLWGGQPVTVAGFHGVAFKDTPAEVLSILGVLAIDPEAFSVELVHPVSGESLRRYDLPAGNAGNAASGAFAGCYG